MDAKLEQRLQHNYETLIDPSILDDIVRLYREFPDPNALQEEPLIALKRLTKVASHFIQENGTKPPKELSDELLAWTFDLGEMAIRRMETGQYDPDARNCHAENVERMRAHIYGHNASILEEFARRSSDHDEKLYLHLLAYAKNERSIQIAEAINSESEYRGYKRGRCGDIARKIAESQQNPDEKVQWLKAAYRDLEECRITIEKYDAVHATHQHMHKATTAQKISELEDREIWTQRALEDCLEGAQRARALDDRCKGYVLSYAHRILEEIADGEKNKETKEHLLREAYAYGNEAMRSARRKDPKHAAITAANIGRTAEKLFKITRDKEWRDTAISDYATCRNYFEKNPDEEIYGFLRSIGGRIQELLGIKNEGKNYIRNKRKKSLYRKILTRRDSCELSENSNSRIRKKRSRYPNDLFIFMNLQK